MRKSTLMISALSLVFACAPAIAETYLIDVRTPAEFEEAHINGAINIEYQKILEEAESAGIKTDDEIFLYCRSGKRAETAKASLTVKGYKHVTNLGGIEDAKAALGR